MAGAKPLVVAKGAPYSSVFVCRTERGVNSIADLRGRRIAFVGPGSASGNYIPKLLLKRAGIVPEKDVVGSYAGGHETAELAVKQGGADCAADARSSYQTMVDKGVIDGPTQRIIAESDPIPVSTVLIVRGDNGKARQAVKATSFAPATDADFTLFREAAAELGVDLHSLSQKGARCPILDSQRRSWISATPTAPPR